MTNQEQYELICEKSKKYDRLVGVLDKIRAEIEELDRYYDNDYFSFNTSPMYKCNEVLQIIDKYTAEIKPKESET